MKIIFFGHFSKIDQKTDFITNEKKNFIIIDNR